MIPIFIIVLFLIDLYVFQGLKLIIQNVPTIWQRIIVYAYWGVFGVISLGLLYLFLANPDSINNDFRRLIIVVAFVTYFSKLFAVLVLLVEDFTRLLRWLASVMSPTSGGGLGQGKEIPRSEFLAKAAIVAAGTPFVAMGYGIISGAHDYRIRRKTIVLKNLPKAFDGIKIGQLSDIHSGSFFNKTAVKGGIEMFLKEKPDIAFFTGDLVNDEASEVKDYIEIFDKVKAPLGTFSTLGNHDYGDYKNWSSQTAKNQNLKNLIQTHKNLGWDILMNENRLVKVDGEQIAILGNENWGAGRFTKYGDLEAAYSGSENAPVKILLSHDPSHWDAQVRPKHPDIDLMLAGHTHGFQFGVEVGNFKWSPSQYVYKQWAGLYEEDDQFLYVNRGFGYLGFPGRVGMPPEITILELKSA